MPSRAGTLLKVSVACAVVLAASVHVPPARSASVPTSVFEQMVYHPAFGGGVRVAHAEIGEPLIVTAPGPTGGPHVRVMRPDGSVFAEWFAYHPGFRGGVFVAAGDVDGDGKDEVVTGPGAGGGPHVRVWDVAPGRARPVAERFAYSPGFVSGVSVAAADVDGDLEAEVVTGPGPGGAPHVRILDASTPTMPAEAELGAYAASFTGGVWVGGGNFDADQEDEVVTGAGASGGPHVRVFDADGAVVPIGGFFAFAPSFLGGVRVGAGDFTGDGTDEVLVGAGPGGGPHIRAVSTDGAQVDGLSAYHPSFRGGVFVAGGDLDGDADAEIVTGPGFGGGPHVRGLEMKRTPSIQVGTYVDDADVGRAWDIAFLPDGEMLYTEFFTGEIRLRPPAGPVRTLATYGPLYRSGETGMMSIVADPAFASNRRIYTCQGWTDGESRDVRVVSWQLDAGLTSAAPVEDPLVGGIQITSGRHGGCRLMIGHEGRLWISTGDSAVGTTPQDLNSLAGKVLRVDRFSGQGVAGNPFAASADANVRRIYTYGHRNPQGLMLRPGSTQYFSVEHGPNVDDEVNRLTPGGNYGWDPVPGYNEGVPMTDQVKFPGAVSAIWSSGNPTIAPAGGTFVTGAHWAGWDGAMVVAVLKAEMLLTLFLDANGNVAGTTEVLKGTHRMRSAEQGPDGSLYVTTSNTGANYILRITPG